MAKRNIRECDKLPLGNVEAQYVDARQLVLANRQSITDVETLCRAEETALASACEWLLAEVRTDTRMSCVLGSG